MREVERIEDQLVRACEKDAWSGPSLSELLVDVNARKAAAKPIPGVHSIWELVRHISTWQRIVQRRLIEKRYIGTTDEENFPTIVDKSEEAWRNAIAELEQGQRALRKTILKLKDSQLQERLVGKEDSIYVMLHGVVQHNLYHAGQIAILKKA